MTPLAPTQFAGSLYSLVEQDAIEVEDLNIHSVVKPMKRG
jgi:hypothetical protein